MPVNKIKKNKKKTGNAGFGKTKKDDEGRLKTIKSVQEGKSKSKGKGRKIKIKGKRKESK